MDSIIALENGRVASHGAFEDLESQIDGTDLISETTDEAILQNSSLAKPRDSVDSQLTVEEIIEPNVANLQRRESNWVTYQYYFHSAGYLSLFLWAAFTILGAIATSFTSKPQETCDFVCPMTDTL